jgi:K+-sensing histidine kinase KdpD
MQIKINTLQHHLHCRNITNLPTFFFQVQAEKLVVESDDVTQGLMQLISERHVTVLVMGAAADKHYTKYVANSLSDIYRRLWMITITEHLAVISIVTRK